MRAFVLTTGRTGSTTFTRACSHARNYTSGHETNARNVQARLVYPDQHIEVDNRLVYFMGSLHNAYPEAFYVHLVRNPDEVVRSFRRRTVDAYGPGGRTRESLRRLRGRYGWSVSSAFLHGVLKRDERLGPDELDDALRLFVDATNANIAEFLRDKDHLRIELGSAGDTFDRFWNRMEAEGDLEAARAEFQVAHNASRSR